MPAELNYVRRKHTTTDRLCLTAVGIGTFETCRLTSGMSVNRGWSQPVDATLYLEGEMECGLMVHKFHRGFTAAEKTELWDRWKRGESLKAIGRAFGKQSSSIYFLVAPHGGIRPAERRRARLALTLAEREVISRGVTAHQSARSIAKLLGRSTFQRAPTCRCIRKPI
jgi:hypothetical protein